MSFREEIDNLFNRFFEPLASPGETAFLPPIDIAENENEIVVKAELPGLKAEDLDVSVRENMLVISGHKKEETEERREDYYHLERRFGSFYRSIPLSFPVDEDKIDASCHDGILTVHLPKSEKSKPKKITVKGE